jgi:hypothetical protein
MIAAASAGYVAKAIGMSGILSFLFGYIAILLTPIWSYRVDAGEFASDDGRNYVRKFYRRTILFTLLLFIPFAIWCRWNFFHDVTHWTLNLAYDLFQGWFFGLMVIYIMVTLVFIHSTRQERSRLLARPNTGNPPKPVWEYRSRWCFLGMPLVHIRVGERLAGIRGPVKAWIAVGNHAIGGLFAFGGLTIAPFCIGGCAIGLLPLGALALGVAPIGGISVGIWAIGLLAIGWQAVGECALAGRAACGHIGFVVYGFVDRGDNDSLKYIQSHFFLRTAMAFSNYWLWTNCLWVIPSWLIQWRILKEIRRRNLCRYS